MTEDSKDLVNEDPIVEESPQEKKGSDEKVVESDENTTDLKLDEDDDSEGETKVLEGLVEVHAIDDTIIIDLRYATKDNFTGEVIYPVSVCLLRKETALKLSEANKEFMKSGYKIKIWDAYRPHYVQQILWDAAEDKDYVADPKKGSKHNRGAAVDITLVDWDGKEVMMPTGFDDFSQKAWRDYQDGSKEARENMLLLTDVMVKNGFTTISKEWWHFNDSDWEDYPILNMPLEDFIQ